MRKFQKAMTGVLILCIVFHMGTMYSMAADQKPYMYTVTFYAGNNGTFSQSQFKDFLTLDGYAPDCDVVRAADGSSVTVSGIPANMRISYDAAAAGAVDLLQDGRYYVKGLRQSGHDNAEARVDITSFQVTKDLDYVVAYGIRGDMTTYTVLYQDSAGNTLAPSRTYSGNVGDRPVAGYRYIEGYQPQAYNLTKTLVKNAAENIFTFVYSRTAAGGGGSAGSAGDETGAGTGSTAAGETQTVVPGTGAAGDMVPGTAGGAAEDAAASGITTDAGVEAVPDEAAVQNEEPQELMELDDEEIPLAGGEEEPAGNVGGNMLRSVAIGGVAAAALVFLLVLWMKNRRKDESGEA